MEEDGVVVHPKQKTADFIAEISYLHFILVQYPKKSTCENKISNGTKMQILKQLRHFCGCYASECGLCPLPFCTEVQNWIWRMNAILIKNKEKLTEPFRVLCEFRLFFFFFFQISDLGP